MTHRLVEFGNKIVEDVAVEHNRNGLVIDMLADRAMLLDVCELAAESILKVMGAIANGETDAAAAALLIIHGGLDETITTVKRNE